MSARPIGQRAEQMRHDFDRRFAEPPPPRETLFEDLLCIRLCGDPYALRLSCVAGLFSAKRLTRWPCRTAAFLGVAGFRGSIVPAYDLHALLGYPVVATSRWLAVVAASPVALGFNSLDGCLRLPQSCIVQSAPGEAARPHVHQLARVPGVPDLLRPLVDLASALATVRQCTAQGSAPSPQELRP